MDINKDGTFETKRTGDPLNPKYQWRDEDDKALNNNYGNIKYTSCSVDEGFFLLCIFLIPFCCQKAQNNRE